MLAAERLRATTCRLLCLTLAHLAPIPFSVTPVVCLPVGSPGITRPGCADRLRRRRRRRDPPTLPRAATAVRDCLGAYCRDLLAHCKTIHG
jgi:hypothetical protein